MAFVCGTSTLDPLRTFCFRDVAKAAFVATGDFNCRFDGTNYAQEASEARAAGQAARSYIAKSASQILMEDSRSFSSSDRYDIFLSHSYQDADVIYGIKKIIKQIGLAVYVDWTDDPGLDRGKVTRPTAQILRDRMKTCSSLVYVHTPNATQSVWMPWELGYFDGLKPMRVWILPLVSDYDSEFKGQEYLGLYPPIEKLDALEAIDLRGRFAHVPIEVPFPPIRGFG